MPEDTRRRSALDLSGAQTGDLTSRDSAGGDINHHGADPGAVLTFLRDYVFEADQRREVAIKEVAQEIRDARADMGIISDALRSLRERANADDREREERQRELDLQLTDFAVVVSDLTEVSARQSRELRWMRLWVAVLSVALVVAAFVLWRLL